MNVVLRDSYGYWGGSSESRASLVCLRVGRRASMGILLQGSTREVLAYPKPGMPPQGTIYAATHLAASRSIPHLGSPY